MFKAFFTLLGCVMLGAAGQICLKTGVIIAKEALGRDLSVPLILKNPTVVFLNPYVILGFGMYGFSSLLWLTLMSRYRLSLIYPMISLGYVFVVVGSIIVFKDKPTIYTWIALSMIVMGVSLLAKTGG